MSGSFLSIIDYCDEFNSSSTINRRFTRSQRIARRVFTHYHLALKRSDRRVHDTIDRDPPLTPAMSIPNKSLESSKAETNVLGLVRQSLINWARQSPANIKHAKAFLVDYDVICSKYGEKLEICGEDMYWELWMYAQRDICGETSAFGAGLILETSLRKLHDIMEEIAHETLSARPILIANAGNWRTRFRVSREERIFDCRRALEMRWGEVREHVRGVKELTLLPDVDLDEEICLKHEGRLEDRSHCGCG